MKPLYISIAVGLLSGMVGATTVLHFQQADPPTEPVENDFNADAATTDRVRALELAVSEERRARQLLEDELFEMMARMDDSDSAAAELDNPEVGAEERAAIEMAVASARESTVAERMEQRRQALVNQGIGVGRAEWILQREGELQFAAMQARYEAQNGNMSEEWAAARWNPEVMLRKEIGDSDFESYLEAQGRPTMIGVADVMSSSPAATAGLRSGDQIVRYDGERVFSSFELMQRTMGSTGDGQVVIDVLRDGNTIQMVVPRGPIGIQIGGSRRRGGS